MNLCKPPDTWTSVIEQVIPKIERCGAELVGQVRRVASSAIARRVTAYPAPR
jgi:hypothetical protein